MKRTFIKRLIPLPFIKREEKLVWDSGKVEDRESIEILYELRGDKKVLQENYAAMGKWMKAMQKAADESPADSPMGKLSKEELETMPARKKENLRYMINTGFHFGDWLIPSVKNAEGLSDGPASAFLTNTSAVIVLPDGSEKEIGNGSFQL